LLTQYPSSDLAPDAQARIALSLERENNRAAADVAYGAVLAKYPESRQAPNALYKRAQIALQLGNKPEAKKYLEDLVRRYPKSSEAEIAAEQLKDWK
jgi:TolA-binding protein